ncbi:MAG: hypothetical protein AAGB32_04575 [Pseudomonadota bacterium]
MSDKTTSYKVTRGWPPVRRAAQAARCRAQQPWKHSTGPKTAIGKARSAQNTVQHGLRSARWRLELTRLRDSLRAHRQYCRSLRRLVFCDSLPPSPSTFAENRGFMRV